MKYLLMIYHQEMEGERTPDALLPWAQFSQAAPEYGVELGAAPLGLSREAKVVSARNGQLQVTDGPFAETKEQLCGYYVFDCDTREAALKLAGMVPLANIGHIEVRAIREMSPVTAA